MRVYALEAATVRIDTTSTSGYWSVTAGGLFQFGHSKDHRPDLPQLKVALSTLDPLGLPVATDVLEGNRADDPLYIPSVERVRKALKKKELLYVGDAKMAVLETRAFIAAGGDHYLCWPIAVLPGPAVGLSGGRRGAVADGDPGPGSAKSREQLAVQDLVAKRGIERLHVPVLPRRPRFNIAHLNRLLGQVRLQCIRNEFRTIIRA